MNFTQWEQYFTANQNHFDHIKWHDKDELSALERELICGSIAQFQKGEHSEGRNLIRESANWEVRHGHSGYADTIRLFVKEEQRHASVLARFMRRHSIPLIREHWVDNVFKGLRRYLNFEISIIVLLTAEVIAAVYYQALYLATGSTILRSICSQILRDEELHINFQSQTLRTMLHPVPGVFKFCIRQAQRVLLLGTVLVVWAYHRRILRVGGMSFTLFTARCFAELERAHCMIYDRAYIHIGQRTFSI